MSLLDLPELRALRPLSADGRLLFATRVVRTFSYGLLSVVLVLYLAAIGLRDRDIGLLLTATLCLLAFGAVMVYSASSATTLLRGHGYGSGYLVKFLVYGGLGLVAMRVLARDGVAKVQSLTAPLLFASFVLGLGDTWADWRRRTRPSSSHPTSS